MDSVRRTCRKKTRKGNVYSRESAERFAAQMREEFDQRIEAFQCPDCGWWHLGKPKTESPRTNARLIQRCVRQPQPDQEESTMSEANEVLNEISTFDRDYRPAETFNQLPKVENLEEGAGIFRIVSAEICYAKGQERIPMLRLVMIAETGKNAGITFEKACWLSRQDGRDRLGADLVSLGFPIFANPSIAYGKELGAVAPKLAGLRFQAAIRADKNDAAKKYLNINMLVTGPATTTPPAKDPPASQQRPAAAPTQHAQAPAAQTQFAKSQDIPF
jgi:hypothetical protein